MEEKTKEVLNKLKESTIPEIKSIFEKEEVKYFSQIVKKNDKNMTQDRYILITNLSLYNMNKKKIKKKYEISKIIGITSSETENDFIIHMAILDNDLYYICINKNQIIEVLSDCYYDITNKELMVEEVKATDLTKYYTLKGEKDDINTTKFGKIKDEELSRTFSLKKRNGIVQQPTDLNNDIKNYTFNIRNTRISEVHLEDFKLIRVIGYGHFGKVCLVNYIPTNTKYAMKSIKRDLSIDLNTLQKVFVFRNVCNRLSYPFINPIEFCFMTEERIYFITHYCKNLDLLSKLNDNIFFKEDTAKLYAAMIGLGLSQLHKYRIKCSCLNPENILIDSNGYLKISDVGVSQLLDKDNKNHPLNDKTEYLPPEVITGVGETLSSDWWNYGIIVFEMLFGIPPFYSENKEKLIDLIINTSLNIPNKICVTESAKDLLYKLLNKNKEERLGSVNDFEDIKKHPWFKDINFDELIKKSIPTMSEKNTNHRNNNI